MEDELSAHLLTIRDDVLEVRQSLHRHPGVKAEGRRERSGTHPGLRVRFKQSAVKIVRDLSTILHFPHLRCVFVS